MQAVIQKWGNTSPHPPKPLYLDIFPSWDYHLRCSGDFLYSENL